MVTAAQALKMYELLNKYFKNNEDAKAVVAGIEDIVDNKFNTERDRLATKQDIFTLKEDTKQDIFALKEDVLALAARMEQGFKDQLKWTIVLMLGMTSLFVAAIKLL